MPPVWIALLLANVGCRQEMANQPRYKYLESSPLFPDGRAARPLVYGTIPRGSLSAAADVLSADRKTYSDRFPVAVDKALIERGRQRFEIYCSPCHGSTGYGNGMIVQRGFLAPPSLHNQRSRALPAGYIFAVITNGYGAMPGYSYQTPEHDRWAIVAYVRTLQFSQHQSVSSLSPEQRASLETAR